MEDDLDVDPFAELAELAELMESNGGRNYGYRRSVVTPKTKRAWSSLESPPREHEKPFVQPWSEQPAWEHGTPTGYMTKKCRCDECRRWQRDYDAARRPRKVPKSER